MDGRLEYLLGAYYFDESADGSTITRFPANVAASSDTFVTIDNRAYALFGQATYRPDFLEGLYFTPSLRWSRDERKATLQIIRYPVAGGTIVGPVGHGDESFSNVSPGFVVGYDVNDDVMVYARWAQGYKTGGYNVRASTIASFEQGFDEETLNSYEIGLKSSWLDDRLRANIIGFVTKYDDIQLNVQVDPVNPGITDTLNAGKATIKGVELDITARPVEGLTLNLSYAYLDAKYDEITDPTTGANIADRFTYVEAPHNTANFNMEYQFPSTPIGTFVAYLGYSYQDKKKTSTNSPIYVIGSYGLLDARLSLMDIPLGKGDWQVSLFGKNLTDKEYYVAHYQGVFPAAVFGDPRTYGLEVNFEY